MADTPTGETVTPESLSNNGQAPATPVVNAPDAEVEKARKEAEQARMRAAQLENQLREREAADAAAKAKQLEEKEEFKTLYEQTQARLNEIQESQAASERSAQLKSATEDVFKDYSADTVELAKTAGLSLSDDSDAAKASLKEKLDAFQAKVGTNPARPGANNPRQTTPEVVSREQLVARQHPGGESPMAIAGAKGDETVIRSYIRELPAIQRMKEIARNGA
jgi:DNA polymerase III gamma/tau subunit